MTIIKWSLYNKYTIGSEAANCYSKWKRIQSWISEPFIILGVFMLRQCAPIKVVIEVNDMLPLD